MDPGNHSDGSPPPQVKDESTVFLVLRAREGDPAARERLAARFLHPLKRFAHGRVPQSLRGPLDTDDFVQEALVRALNQVDHFEARGPGAFLAYMRQILVNRIRDEVRKAARRPGRSELPENLRDTAPSPLEEVIGREALEVYDKALARLKTEQQEAVIMRIEMSFSYQEIAEATGRPSANAVRMTVSRAVARLAELMREIREQA